MGSECDTQTLRHWMIIFEVYLDKYDEDLVVTCDMVSASLVTFRTSHRTWGMLHVTIKQ